MPSTARSRSASASTMMAFLPPSSSETRLRRPAAAVAMRRPVSPLPVKLMTGTSGLSTSAMPACSPGPVTRLTVPGGKPASWSSSTSSAAQPGVSEAGLSTTVLPATSAGIAFHIGMAMGKFQGVMSPATPMGSRMLMAHLSGSSEGTVSPNSRRPSPAIRNAISMASWTSPRASSRTLPISAVMADARRSLCCASSAPKAYRISPRRGAGVARQPGKAVSAARTAAATSAAPPMRERADATSRVGRVVRIEGRAVHRRAPLAVDEVTPCARGSDAAGRRPPQLGSPGRRRGPRRRLSSLAHAASAPTPLVAPAPMVPCSPS